MESPRRLTTTYVLPAKATRMDFGWDYIMASILGDDVKKDGQTYE